MKAIANVKHLITTDTVFHSDRGVQYSSNALVESLNKLMITPSMSRTDNCYDNAYSERFFCTLKQECLFRKHITNEVDFRREVFKFIEVWYNRNRIHS